ncbi:hypothetical protein AB0A73_24675 [Glycomyces sp. NPDC047369]
MPKSRSRKKMVTRSKRPPKAPLTVSPVDIRCRKCNAAPGEECHPIRWDDNDFAAAGIHTGRGQAVLAAQRGAHIADPATDLSKEMHARLMFPGEPRPEYGLPHDPRTVLDPVDCVNALTTCAIAAAVGCDACLQVYLPYVHGYEYEYLEPWVVEAVARASADHPPFEVSDRSRFWHDMRHLLDSRTGRYLGPDAPGYVRTSLATVGRDTWRSAGASWRGRSAARTISGWSRQRCPYGRSRMARRRNGCAPLLTTSTPTGTRSWTGWGYVCRGAVKTAEYLSERWGVAVTPDHVERLVEDGHLTTVGVYRSRNVYAPHHVDMLTDDMLDVDAQTHIDTQWSELDEELLAAGTHPQSVSGYEPATPQCPHKCRSFVVDRPNDWGRACWRHLSKDEQTEITAERSDIPSESGRYLLVDVERAREYGCTSCGARAGEACTRDIPHRPRILTARRWRRDLRAAGQWVPVPLPTLPRQVRGTPRPTEVACPRCDAPVGKRCVTASGQPADEPHMPRRWAALAVQRA